MNPQLNIQRQQLRREQVELQSALEQLSDDPETYTMVGSLMIRKDASSVREDLEKRLEDVKKQIAILDEQMNEPRRDA